MVDISMEWEENPVTLGCKDVLIPSKKLGGGEEEGTAMMILVRVGREGCVATMISLQCEMREWGVSNDGKEVEVISVNRLRSRID